MKVRANAETPLDCRTARDFGAEGIGLCRTEHMFFEAGRITAVRQMILAENEAGRRERWRSCCPEQRSDFTEIFEVMAGLPVTIRLLDPPLHEFLPHMKRRSSRKWRRRPASASKSLKQRASELHEFNPMLGHRGCRLGVTYPGNLRDAGARHLRGGAGCRGEERRGPIPEVMIPLVATSASWS
jgi:pyruvate,orthophosphate dikinase